MDPSADRCCSPLPSPLAPGPSAAEASGSAPAPASAPRGRFCDGLPSVEAAAVTGAVGAAPCVKKRRPGPAASVPGAAANSKGSTGRRPLPPESSDPWRAQGAHGKAPQVLRSTHVYNLASQCMQLALQCHWICRGGCYDSCVSCCVVASPRPPGVGVLCSGSGSAKRAPRTSPRMLRTSTAHCAVRRTSAVRFTERTSASAATSAASETASTCDADRSPFDGFNSSEGNTATWHGAMRQEKEEG